jgi:hypothetical protein
MLEIDALKPISQKIKCFKATLKIPQDDEVDVEEMKARWKNMYDTAGEKFFILVDLRSASLLSWKSATLIPDIISLLSEMREKTEKQVLATVCVSHPNIKWIIDSVMSVYKPVRPMYTAENIDDAVKVLEKIYMQK